MKVTKCHILVVGTPETVTASGLSQASCAYEIVGSIAEAVSRRAEKDYDLVIIDNDALGPVSHEILTKDTFQKHIDSASLEDEEKHYALFDKNIDAIFLTRPDGSVQEVNDAACRMFGMSKDELIRTGRAGLVDDSDPELPKAIKQREETGEFRGELRLKRKDGTTFPTDTSSVSFVDAHGEARAIVIVRDITEKKQLEHEQFISSNLLSIINDSNSVRELLESSIAFLRYESECEALAIRLKSDEDIPYCVVHGFSEEFLKLETSLLAHDVSGEILRDSSGNPVLECMCGNIVQGRFDPALPFFTEYGSFWTNSTTHLLSSTTEEDRQAHTRNRCHYAGYESVALIPLKIGDEILGLLQLNDKRKGMFTLETIELWERLAEQLAIAISKLQVEESLIESEDRLRLFIEHAPVALAMFDTGMRYIAASRRWIDDYGLDGKDIIGLSHYDVFPEIEDNWKAVHRRCLNGAVERREEDKFERADGSVQWLRWEVRPWKTHDDKIGGLAIFSEDITARKNAEEALARAKAEAERRSAELESFIANAGDGVAILDTEGQIILMNEAGSKILGIPPGESYHNWLDKFQRFHLDGTPLEKDQSSATRALRGETVTDMQYKVITPWNKEFIISVTASPVKNSEGQITSATTIFRDVSEQVAFERERNELLTREHHIAEVLQHALVPKDFPSELKGYRFASTYRSALREAEIGGDFYDVFDFSDDKIGILIGDVAGKGLPAAIRVAAARHSIRSYAYLDPSPDTVMTLANEALCRDQQDEAQMLTAFFGVLDAQTGKFTYCNAGQEPPIICHREGKCEELQVFGTPLGALQNIEYTQSTATISECDKFICVTDGITEARTKESVLYGKERLMEFVSKNLLKSPKSIAKGILRSAIDFAGGDLQDDAAVIVFEKMASL